MKWLAHPSWQGVGAIAGIVGAVAAVLSIPFFKRRKPQRNHAIVVVERFICIFEAHGIERTQISRFLGDNFKLKLTDFSTNSKLLLTLDEEILDYVCALFGVRRAWIDGASEQMYERLMHYKDLPEFARFIAELTKMHPDQLCILHAYKASRTSVDLFKDQPDVSLVFAKPIAEFDEATIYRYYPLYGPLPWRHSEARFNLYAFFTLAFSTRGLVIKGHNVQSKLIAEISEGKIIPETIKAEGVWHPEDYAFSSISHEMPMNLCEISGFWNYMQRKDWLEFFDKNIITRPA